MSAPPPDVVADELTELADALHAAANPELAEPMAAYMKNHFDFLGIKTPERRAIAKPFMTTGARCDSDEIMSIAHWLWEQPYREFQYVGSEFCRKWAKHLEPSALPDVEELIITKSWWDTVDGLAPHTVGPLVTANPELREVMDQWIDDENIWLARTALIHQLFYRNQTDADRLFDYCRRRMADKEFFIRKAIGWSLRQYARTDADAVRAFVRQHESELSGLSKREALKHIGQE